jgi:hypothetical protein
VTRPHHTHPWGKLLSRDWEESPDFHALDQWRKPLCEALHYSTTGPATVLAEDECVPKCEFCMLLKEKTQ